MRLLFVFPLTLLIHQLLSCLTLALSFLLASCTLITPIMRENLSWVALSYKMSVLIHVWLFTFSQKLIQTQTHTITLQTTTTTTTTTTQIITRSNSPASIQQIMELINASKISKQRMRAEKRNEKKLLVEIYVPDSIVINYWLKNKTPPTTTKTTQYENDDNANNKYVVVIRLFYFLFF